MKEKKIIRTIKEIVLALFILIIIPLIIPIPINKVYNAVEIKLDDPNYCVNCQVKINGKYHINLLTDDMFDGQIAVSDYSLTNKEMSKIIFYDYDIGYPLEYHYYKGYDEDGHRIRYTYFLGHIHAKPLFHQMDIVLFL